MPTCYVVLCALHVLTVNTRYNDTHHVSTCVFHLQGALTKISGVRKNISHYYSWNLFILKSPCLKVGTPVATTGQVVSQLWTLQTTYINVAPGMNLSLCFIYKVICQAPTAMFSKFDFILFTAFYSVADLGNRLQVYNTINDICFGINFFKVIFSV